MNQYPDFDQKLYDDLRRGKEYAFAAVFERYNRLLYTIAYRFLKSEEEAEDAIQYLFMKLWEQRTNFSFESGIRSLLFTILKNYILNELRHRSLVFEKLYEMAQQVNDEDEDEAGDDMKLTSLQSITDFMNCAGRTLPDNIRLWARRNLAVARSHEVSPEERRHAQRALSIMMNVQWKSNYFEAIDPDEARRILDEELYGMERVKQRIIETIIQINRTHTLPAYGLLLVGPAGTGKSQIAYAVARILKLPWTTLDMSSINDPEQLTGSSRIYANAKTGIIMDAFAMAGESNLVFIINELDKAASGKGNGNPADVLLTLLDNLGFTDNYIECMIPTVGVYPIATANDKSQISAPLMSRFAVIDIPDYTPEEKKVIFSKFALPKVLKRMSLKEDECIMSEEGLDELIKLYSNTSGIRDLEQAAEHIAANALYQIEVDHVKSVTFDAEMVRNLLR